WCCLPRIDAGSSFGRLLDWDNAGHCTFGPTAAKATSARRYLDDTLVLCTDVTRGGAHVRVYDFMVMPGEGVEVPHELVRIAEGVTGEMTFALELEPRFDYGTVAPWVRRHSPDTWSATGGDDAMLIWSDVELELIDQHRLAGRCTVRAGERKRLLLGHSAPEDLDDKPAWTPERCDARLKQTIANWRRWAKRIDSEDVGVRRSVLVLHALTNARTGGMAAAATTSLPESARGRTWDYRYCWIRDSTFATRALAEVGCGEEADAFRRFIQRSSAGTAEDLQIVYGVRGARRIGEQELPELEGWRGIGPVRVGNSATGQFQLDAYGELVNLAWRWHERGNSPDDDLWRFLVTLVDHAAERWREPDRGIWEWRPRPRHWVHSKALCWTALDRGLRLAEECMRKAPVTRWRKERSALKRAIEREGYDRKSGTFVQWFGSAKVDASLLQLPVTGFVDWDDERMVRTADAVREQLDDRGLIRRHADNDGQPGREGAFLACSFWLVECLARQARGADAREVFDVAMATANDLGLFSEEFDTRSGEMMGNFPQALTHLSHVAAAHALEESDL
ncbi:MAG: glycoside hydrolase family 15 protein, partial [Actinobacteria bacterium]